MKGGNSQGSLNADNVGGGGGGLPGGTSNDIVENSSSATVVDMSADINMGPNNVGRGIGSDMLSKPQQEYHPILGISRPGGGYGPDLSDFRIFPQKDTRLSKTDLHNLV